MPNLVFLFARPLAILHYSTERFQVMFVITSAEYFGVSFVMISAEYFVSSSGWNRFLIVALA